MKPGTVDPQDRFVEMLLERDLGESRRALEDDGEPEIEAELATPIAPPATERGAPWLLVSVLVIAAVVVWQMCSA